MIMCRSPCQSWFVNREPGHQGARVGNPGQTFEISIIYGIVCVLRIGTGRTFHKAGAVMGKAIDTFWVCKNEMNRALGHFCAHTGLIGPGEPLDDGEMTLPSRHRIRNSNPGGLRPRTLSLGHGGSPHTSGWGRNIFVSFKPPRPGNEPRTLAWKAAVLTKYVIGPGPS